MLSRRNGLRFDIKLQNLASTHKRHVTSYIYIYIYIYISLGLIYCVFMATIVGCLMENPVFAHILNIWFVNTFSKYPQLNDPTVLFLTIQFSIGQQSWMVSRIAMNP